MAIAESLAQLDGKTVLIVGAVGAVRPLAETRDAFLTKQGTQGKTIIQVASHRPGEETGTHR
jgi:hypothetical protein